MLTLAAVSRCANLGLSISLSSVPAFWPCQGIGHSQGVSMTIATREGQVCTLSRSGIVFIGTFPKKAASRGRCCDGNNCPSAASQHVQVVNACPTLPRVRDSPMVALHSAQRRIRSLQVAPAHLHCTGRASGKKSTSAPNGLRSKRQKKLKGPLAASLVRMSRGGARR